MIVLRKTMNAAVEAERAKVVELARTYGEAVRQTAALQKQLADWITDKGDQLTPEQAAALFWSRDDHWQAAFFNSIQPAAQSALDALPPARPGEFRGYPDMQWCFAADRIDDKGFEFLESMFEYAKSAREKVAA